MGIQKCHTVSRSKGDPLTFEAIAAKVPGFLSFR